MQTTQTQAYPRGLGPVAGALDWFGALGGLVNRAVAGVFGFAEDALTQLNAPALILVGVVAAVAVMSNGALLAQWPWLNQGWPLALALGVDIMALVAIRYCVSLLMRFILTCLETGGIGRGWPLAVVGGLWGGVVVVLAGVIYMTNRVFGYQLMTGGTEADALAHYGITAGDFVDSRAALVAGLTVLTGIVLALRQITPLVERLTASWDAPQRATLAASGPQSSRPTVRIPATPAPNKRVAVAAPAYASYRTDQQLAALNPEWERLARAYCADKPEIGGKKLAAYLASQLGEENAPSKSKAQELARMFRPAVLKLQAGRPALA